MVERFMRASPEVNIQVVGDVAALTANDSFPPARINDVQVLESDPSSMTVKLQWTAMGDNYDVGNGRITFDVGISVVTLRHKMDYMTVPHPICPRSDDNY